MTVLFLLPWQTRWMYSEASIAGAHTEFGVMSVYATEILLVFGVLMMMVFNRGRLAVAHRNRRVVGLGGIAVMVVMLSIIFADRPLFSSAMSVHILLAYGLFVALVDERVSTKHALGAYVAALLAPMMLGVFQVFIGASPAVTWLGLAARDITQLGESVFVQNGERILRAYGSFSHPNIFGGFLGVGVFAWWAFMAQVKRIRSVYVHRGLTIVGTAVLLGGMMLTGSRSAFLGVTIGIVLMICAKILKKTSKTSIALVMIGVLAIGGSMAASFAAPDLAASIRGGGVNEERSLADRAALYQEFIPFMAQTNPVIGHGIGSYVLSFSDQQPGRNAFEYQPIHNVPLLMLAEIGFLGLIGMLCFMIMAGRTLFTHLPHRNATYALGMGTVLVTISFFDHYLWSSWSGLALCAFVCAMTVRLGE